MEKKDRGKSRSFIFYILSCLCFLLLILPMNCHKILGGAKAHHLKKTHLDGNGEGPGYYFFLSVENKSPQDNPGMEGTIKLWNLFILCLCVEHQCRVLFYFYFNIYLFGCSGSQPRHADLSVATCVESSSQTKNGTWAPHWYLRVLATDHQEGPLSAEFYFGSAWLVFPSQVIAPHVQSIDSSCPRYAFPLVRPWRRPYRTKQFLWTQ